MKESLNNINTNLECGYKFKNNTKDYRLQYIKYLPKTQYFRRGHIDFEKIFKKIDNTVLMHCFIMH